VIQAVLQISFELIISTEGGYGNYTTTSYGGQGGMGGGGFMPGETNSPATGRVRILILFQFGHIKTLVVDF
jgi:hypothetical protein